MPVLECNENNKDLYFARTKNGVGSKFYKIFEYDNFYQHLVLQAKCACFLFIPIFSFGYILTTPDGKILSTVSCETFDKIKKEVLIWNKL